MNKKYLKITLFFLLVAVLAAGGGILVANYKIQQTKKLQSANVADNAVPGNGQVAENNSPLNEVNNQSEPVVPVAPQENISADTTSNNSTSDANKPFSFAIIGDTKVFSASNPNGNLQKAVASIVKQNVDFSFVMGDLVSSCDGGSVCEGKYNDWKKVMAPLLSKTYEIVGNHDRTGGSAADAVWQKEFNLPTNGPSGFSELTYSFDAGNSHFVVLNSEKPKEHVVDSVQRDWLEKDLAANKKENVFVFFHEPAFQTGQNKKDGLDANPKERDLLLGILNKYNVKVAFNGHEHIFTIKKIGNMYQIVEGDTDSTNDDTPQSGLSDYGYKGKAYTIISVDGNKINLKLYSVDGNLIKTMDLF